MTCLQISPLLLDYMRTTQFIYRIIHSADDIQKLQEDLNILHQWSKDWFMVFTYQNVNTSPSQTNDCP